MQGFGQHLMVDGYNGNKYKLQDLDLVYSFLNNLPIILYMTKIMPPYVFKYHGEKKEDWGISGVVIIAESHVSLHTFPEKQYLSCDVFSCKEFNSNIVQKYIKDIFRIEKTEINLLNRGLEFPRNINLTKNIVTRQREEL